MWRPPVRRRNRSRLPPCRRARRRVWAGSTGAAGGSPSGWCARPGPPQPTAAGSRPGWPGRPLRAGSPAGLLRLGPSGLRSLPARGDRLAASGRGGRRDRTRARCVPRPGRREGRRHGPPLGLQPGHPRPAPRGCGLPGSPCPAGRCPSGRRCRPGRPPPSAPFRHRRRPPPGSPRPPGPGAPASCRARRRSSPTTRARHSRPRAARPPAGSAPRRWRAAWRG